MNIFIHVVYPGVIVGQDQLQRAGSYKLNEWLLG
jgi:hypothetical protein